MRYGDPGTAAAGTVTLLTPAANFPPRAQFATPHLDPNRLRSTHTVRSRRTTFWLSLALTLVVVVVTALPLCGQMFRCGCTFAGAAHCNIHHATPPHCPWCAHDSRAFYASFAAIIPLAAGAIFAITRRRKSLLLGTLTGVAAYVVVALISGFITARTMGYATFFGFNI